MPGTITINLPLKPYLIKYLEHKYGDNHRITRTSWLGKYFIDILDKTYRKNKVDIKRDMYYRVSIPASIIKEFGFDISGLKMKNISDMIYKVFINDLYSYIDVSIGNDLKFYNVKHKSINNQNTVRAINQFLMFYNISEDELSADTLYRNFCRYKETKKSREQQKVAQV